MTMFGKADGLPNLNGMAVDAITADLQAGGNSKGADLTQARRLGECANACFMGVTKVGPFDLPAVQARNWLALPNPDGRSNADALRVSWNGLDVTRRQRDVWIVDFGATGDLADASMYEAPFEYAQRTIQPFRQLNNREAYRKFWWRHGEARPGLRHQIARAGRFIATPEVAKHRLFVWCSAQVLPDKNLQCTPRADETTFGALHSRMHELWSLRLGSSLEDRPRYTPTTCFETFPFPAGLTPADTAHQRTETLPDGAVIPADLSPAVRPQAEAIARAAKRLVDLRDAWLNPPEWTDRVPEVVPLGMAASPYPDRIVAKPGHEAELAKRTLTNLYNARPAWLASAHAALDVAVASAYGWTDYTTTMSDDEILRRLLVMNLARATGVAR